MRKFGRHLAVPEEQSDSERAAKLRNISEDQEDAPTASAEMLTALAAAAHRSTPRSRGGTTASSWDEADRHRQVDGLLDKVNELMTLVSSPLGRKHVRPEDFDRHRTVSSVPFHRQRNDTAASASGARIHPAASMSTLGDYDRDRYLSGCSSQEVMLRLHNMANEIKRLTFHPGDDCHGEMITSTQSLPVVGYEGSDPGSPSRGVPSPRWDEHHGGATATSMQAFTRRPVLRQGTISTASSHWELISEGQQSCAGSSRLGKSRGNSVEDQSAASMIEQQATMLKVKQAEIERLQEEVATLTGSRSASRAGASAAALHAPGGSNGSAAKTASSPEAEAVEGAQALRRALASWNQDMERLQKSQEREMDELQRRTTLQQHLERRDRALAEALARERALQAEVARLEGQRLRAPKLASRFGSSSAAVEEVASAMPQVRDPGRFEDSPRSAPRTVLLTMEGMIEVTSPRSPCKQSPITEARELPSTSSLFASGLRQGPSMPPSRGRFLNSAAHDGKCCSRGTSVTVVSAEDLQHRSRQRTPSPGCLSARAILAAQPPVIAYSTLLPRSQYRTSSPRMSPSLSARTTPNGSSRMLMSASPSVTRQFAHLSNPESLTAPSVAAGAPDTRGLSPEPVARPLSPAVAVWASPPMSATPVQRMCSSPASLTKLRQASPTASARERYLC